MRKVNMPSISAAIGVVTIVAGLWVFALGPGWSGAATARYLHQIHVEEDAFLNYDFQSEDHASDNVDWAVSLIFWNNSSIDSIKEDLHFWFPSSGDPMHAYLNNGAGWNWDTDSGIKEHYCTVVGDNVHFRIYGPPADHLYNRRWGFYNIATDHIDHNECNYIDKWSGESEKAEGIIARVFGEYMGEQTVKRDWAYLENLQLPEQEGDHHWENDGFATKLRMPGIDMRKVEEEGGAT
jgi:hypothetical protein